MKTLGGRLKIFAAGLLLLWILDGVLALLFLPHTAFAEGTAFLIFHFGAAALLSVKNRKGYGRFWKRICRSECTPKSASCIRRVSGNDPAV